ncbi:hypothetical protein OH76DRAFT_1408368 [Lentinus brumalis]|uniref:Uncharacterized protein n=1 Tax=Lentinus brumalis TaxID=2498619 RepID=A0A371CXT8_9APHY|nr:hypothetical protein OH76DRAFT_1408368 [Polyporus brumalis]
MCGGPHVRIVPLEVPTGMLPLTCRSTPTEESYATETTHHRQECHMGSTSWMWSFFMKTFTTSEDGTFEWKETPYDAYPQYTMSSTGPCVGFQGRALWNCVVKSISSSVETLRMREILKRLREFASSGTFVIHSSSRYLAMSAFVILQPYRNLPRS